MRLHHLQVDAFGPFAGAESVDFDTLTDSGLFLLCGQTGAGKTSLLDAVCFALFGQVPGERDKAKRLRSDHAARGQGPRVVLEVTLRGRRLRITRSPEWMRPKKRGTGDIREHAKVLLEELVDREWQQRTNRIDEAGDLVGSLVGMSMTQFCQVVMLPQGRFETFLRAGAQERHTLLEKLFGAQRFRAVEEWLLEHRRRLGAESDVHAEQVDACLERIAEAGETERPAVASPAATVAAPPAATVALPAASPTDRLTTDDDPEHALSWAACLHRETLRLLAEATDTRTAADQRAKQAHADLDTARDLAELQRRHQQAQRCDDDLRALDDESSALARRVEQARSAQAVRPLLDGCDATRRRRERAEAALRDARAAAPDAECPGTADPSAIVAALQRCRDEHARLQTVVPLQDEVADHDRDLMVVRRQQQERCTTSRRLQTGLDAVTADLQALRARHADASAAGPRVEVLRAQTERAERIAAAAGRLDSTLRARPDLHRTLHEAVDIAQRARAAWLDLRQARLDGMAAELARDLSPGHGCPVCGSVDHPAPAHVDAGAVSAADEQVAESHYLAADERRQRAAAALAESDRTVAADESAAEGRSVEQATRELAALRAELASLAELAADVDALQTRLLGLGAVEQELRQELTSLTTTAARLDEQQASLARARDAVLTKIVGTAGELTSLAERLARTGQASQRLDELLAATREHADAARAHDVATRQLAQACAAAGLGSAEQARRSALTRAELSNAEALLDRRGQEAARVRAVLEDPAVAAAAALPAVDLEQPTTRLDEARAERDDAVARERSLLRRSERLELLHARLEQAVAEWAPVRHAHLMAGRIAALCAGTSRDNTHRMRLSAYVLAARLEQVVAAANERLVRMSSGRYTLRHRIARGVGDTRGGLGLQIQDGWTGESRDPATLSGGETFLASLALALGLADVVTQEAGGVDIGTLFVDEGFGSLDPDTLDEVMDVLDTLRSGGRCVGIVSHVADLRARVPAQVHVHKTRQGSTLAATR